MAAGKSSCQRSSRGHSAKVWRSRSPARATSPANWLSVASYVSRFESSGGSGASSASIRIARSVSSIPGNLAERMLCRTEPASRIRLRIDDHRKRKRVPGADRFEKLGQPRGRHDKTAEHPCVRATPRCVVLCNRIRHRELCRREKPGIVDERAECGASGRRECGRGAHRSHHSTHPPHPFTMGGRRNALQGRRRRPVRPSRPRHSTATIAARHRQPAAAPSKPRS